MIQNRQQTTVTLLIMVTLLATGCVDNSDAQLMSDARRFTVVTRIDPSFRPEIGDSLIWLSDLIVQDANSEVKATDAQAVFVKETIESLLLRKRYRLTEDEAQADYMVAAAVLMDNSSESQEITELVQIYPGLGDAFNDHEQGTLVMIIVAPDYTENSPILWRGAIQAYALGDALPEEFMLARLEGIVTRLVNAVPLAGG
jgi:hypothetical protein